MKTSKFPGALVAASLLVSVYPIHANSQSINKGNVTVTLDANRGGQVGSINIVGQGETILNDLDGRGMGTSGILFNESGGSSGGLWYEGGCIGNGGNSDVAFTTTPTYVTGTALTKTYYQYPSAPCDKSAPWKNFQFTHTAWFPTAYDGAVAIRQTLYNGVGSSVTPTQTNDGFHWPFLPQVHLARAKFTSATTGVGYWRYRNSDASWADFPFPGVSHEAGWLDSSRDFYLPSGHAIAVYSDPTLAWGVALYCPQLDYGFYAKDMTSYGNIFMASVWTFNSSIAPSGTVEKTCYLLYGSEAVISSVLTNL